MAYSFEDVGKRIIYGAKCRMDSLHRLIGIEANRQSSCALPCDGRLDAHTRTGLPIGERSERRR